MAYKMKGSSFYPKNGKSPIKGLFGGIMGKVLNPASMLPGKMGDIAGKLNPLSGILMTGCACGKKKCNCK